MKVLFFGRLGDRFGREVEIELPPGGCSVDELRQMLQATLPGAAEELARPRVRACIDQQLAEESDHIGPEQEVAFVPPLSGG